jgi:hypothetical protein
MIRSTAAFHEAPPANFDGVFLWDYLKPAWKDDKRNLIEPTDFDAVVHKNNNFLVFETKDPGVLVSRGQMIAFRDLVLDRRFTVVFCAKRSEDVNGWDVMTRNGTIHMEGNAADLRSWCACWFIHATQWRAW